MTLRKLFALVLTAAALTLVLTACGSTDASVSGTSEPETSESDTTLGQSLAQSFQDQVVLDTDMDLADIVQAVTDDAQLPFAVVTAPVEEGLLTGCGNQEITGFTEGVTFGPEVSTVPFLGYVFRTADDSAAVSLLETLKECADPDWNVCTSADETILQREGNLVFFLMCPESLEEA